MNNAFLYCLIEAAQRYEIVLLLSQMMGNHKHTGFYDPKGNAIEFTHRFHTLLAKWVNAHRRRRENVWASEPPSLVELETADDVVAKLVYTATNPVKAGLVESVDEWPGPATVRAFLDGRTLKARRPKRLFRNNGRMPEEVEARFVMPPELGDHDAIVACVRTGIAEMEKTCAAERARTQACVVGRRRILRQSWGNHAQTPEPRRELRPRVAARNPRVRIEALRRNKQFQSEYREALKLWRDDKDVMFPEGTYWLRKYANVRVRSATLRPATC
jgi:putative transposase